MRKIATILSLFALLVLPTVALAQTPTPFSIEDVGTTIGLGTADLKDTVVNIIQWVLGILALVAVVMIIIGGFQWMTAAGSEERIEKAKKVISSAVIGLIIVLLAWAIVIFVAGTTANVTT
jgi:type IV secretory pathway VirB2 component (pilin)